MSLESERAKALYNSGNEAAQRSNFDYAMQMYRDACRLQPDNVQYRQTLRTTERKKFSDDPSKVGFFVKAQIKPLQFRVKAAKMKSQWSQVLALCEDIFALNPWDLSASRDASEAAEELGFRPLALWLLESVAASANDAGFFEHQAHAYEINNEFQKAIQCWERVGKLSPNNEGVKRHINSLAAKATIVRSGLEDSIKERKAAASKPAEMPTEADDLKKPRLTPEEQLLQQIEEQPTLVGNYLDLVEFYRNRNQLEDAQKLLSRGLKAVPGDATLQWVLGDVQTARLQVAVDAWGKRCQERPDDEQAKATLEKIVAKRDEYEISEFQRRASLRPEDMSLQFQLGLRLARIGKHREAITCFQQARNDANLKVQALHHAGLSFEADGVHKLAERHYEDALKAADPAEIDTLNALHYRLGRVAETQNDITKALEHYHEVAANDYGYLDVAQRLRNLQ